jgi:hypothetical protein
VELDASILTATWANETTQSAYATPGMMTASLHSLAWSSFTEGSNFPAMVAFLVHLHLGKTGVPGPQFAAMPQKSALKLKGFSEVGLQNLA